jgi:hypothetical protein
VRKRVKIFLSHSSKDRRFVERLATILDTHKIYILVLTLRPANFKKLSWTLSQLQWIDFTRGFDRGRKAFLRSWRKTHRRS